MTEERLLRRDEIPLVWEIDRSEVIGHLYSVEAGQLVLRPEFYDMRGWPEGEAEHYTPILLDCFDRGGWFLGLFDQGRLIGAVVLDPRRLGPERDWLQLKFLHPGPPPRRQRALRFGYAVAEHGGFLYETRMPAVHGTG